MYKYMCMCMYIYMYYWYKHIYVCVQQTIISKRTGNGSNVLWWEGEHPWPPAILLWRKGTGGFWPAALIIADLFIIPVSRIRENTSQKGRRSALTLVYRSRTVLKNNIPVSEDGSGKCVDCPLDLGPSFFFIYFPNTILHITQNRIIVFPPPLCIYHPVMCYIAIQMAIEFVDLPVKHGDFP